MPGMGAGASAGGQNPFADLMRQMQDNAEPARWWPISWDSTVIDGEARSQT